MPTEVVHTVGSGGDYSTLAAWETAQQRDLVSADEIAVAEIIGGTNVGNPTGRVDFTGWTTDATRYLHIRPQTGSEYDGVGELDISKAYVQATVGGNNGALFPRVDTRFSQIQVEVTSTTGAPGAKCFFLFGSGSIQVDRCLLKFNLDAGNTSAQDGNFFELRGASSSCVFSHNIMVLDANGGTGSSQPCYNQTAVAGPSTHYMYNNTILVLNKPSGNVFTIATRNGEDTICDNNYLHSSSPVTIHYLGSVGSTVTGGNNDATSNTEAATAGLQNVAYSAATFENITLGSLDLTPLLASVLTEGGADLSGTLSYATDIAGNPLPTGVSWDIGALENQSVAIVPFTKEVDVTVLLGVDVDTTHDLELVPDGDASLLLDINTTLELEP